MIDMVLSIILTYIEIITGARGVDKEGQRRV